MVLATLCYEPAVADAAQPALPQEFVDTSLQPPKGKTISVSSGGDLQGALNSAQPGDVIELQAEDAKGDCDEENARLIPMVGKDLAGILERRKIARQVKAGDTTTLAALIFHHNGKPIVDIRKAWKTACKKAGVPGRLFHDLRRSACKNLDEAGVSRDVAMSISGHKTQAMYSRYNISDVKRKRRALEKVQEYREAQAAQESNVVTMKASR